MVGNGEILVNFATDRHPVVRAEDMVDSDIHSKVAVAVPHSVSRLSEAVGETVGDDMMGIRSGRTIEVATQHHRSIGMFSQCP